ncbi:YceI family protein [Cochleicola gelatinilyticus]|uniref:Lipid-binding protein n=1 Tax=Cochleicola gelatinilyticus TaxID=1763537 RepID=A0A167EQX9_9FLAO|nr:YceI family protein [Cochleicola gelatinilyticus]OAB75787.1 lipid-binding protein [Cochleicola gelatinilyticus]
MKKTILNSVLIAVLAVGAVSCKDAKNGTDTKEAQEVAEATEMSVEYTVDTAASKVQWEGSKPAGTHNGTVNVSSGTVSTNDGVIEAGNFVIDMSSITVEDLEGEGKESLEAHLKGTVDEKKEDFFNINQYPTASFELTGVSNKEGKTMVDGNLTIKDKTNNISFPATVAMNGDSMTLTSEPFVIDRTEWGVNFMSKSVFDDLKDKFISDDITLTVRLVATK